MMFRDTIYALSSGTLPSAIAVVRLSGPQVVDALGRLIGFVPEPRHLELATVRGRDGDEIDRGLVAYFAAPASFTGEDSAELQLHGSRAVISALFRELSTMPNLRAAEAGEFARRAHLNGKFDLTGAEALADLIDAETEAQRRFALANASGRNALVYQNWRDRIIHARAMIEAELDFSDEEDVPCTLGGAVWDDLSLLRQEIETHTGEYSRAEIVREGYQVALIGPPNAGKSSLLNALIRRDAAIVSDEPGTTRDLVVVNLDLGGLKVVLTDTAGIREGVGAVELQGIARAREAAEAAHCVLRLHDVTDLPSTLSDAEYENEISVGTKLDLLPAGENSVDAGYDITVSAKTGEGLAGLLALLKGRVQGVTGGPDCVVPFRARHVEQLRTAERLLGEAVQDETLVLELRAEILRQASLALGRIIGDVDVEDILDVIFSRFCIGK